jgi:hypothetical protein
LEEKIHPGYDAQENGINPAKNLIPDFCFLFLPAAAIVLASITATFRVAGTLAAILRQARRIGRKIGRRIGWNVSGSLFSF